LTNPASTSVIVGEVMAKRTVVLVLALVYVVPVLTYFPPDESNQFALDYAESLVGTSEAGINPMTGQKDLLLSGTCQECVLTHCCEAVADITGKCTGNTGGTGDVDCGLGKINKGVGTAGTRVTVACNGGRIGFNAATCNEAECSVLIRSDLATSSEATCTAAGLEWVPAEPLANFARQWADNTEESILTLRRARFLPGDTKCSPAGVDNVLADWDGKTDPECFEAVIDKDISDYRDTEMLTVYSSSGRTSVVVVIKDAIQQQSYLNMGLMFVIICFFIIGALMFKTVIDEHVVKPVEKVTNMIKKLSATLTCLAGDMDEDGNEMEYIQIAFKKMGGLLTMVYGEAGADTLRNNIVGEATGIDPNVRGKMIDGIFGFCDIREFTAATVRAHPGRLSGFSVP
jgi:hypothetical protein